MADASFSSDVEEEFMNLRTRSELGGSDKVCVVGGLHPSLSLFGICFYCHLVAFDRFRDEEEL